MIALDTRAWQPEDAALADLFLGFVSEDGADSTVTDMDTLAGAMAAIQTALTLALVDPDWARRVVDRVLTDAAARAGTTMERARAEEWDYARRFIAEHPID